MLTEQICDFTRIAVFPPDPENWLFRYQTLIVGALAVFVALLQALIFWRQNGLTKGQMAIMAKQEEIQQAVDRVQINRAYEWMGRLHDYMGSFVGHNEELTTETFFVWYPNEENWDYIASLPGELDANQLIHAMARILPPNAARFDNAIGFYNEVRRMALMRDRPINLTPAQNRILDKFFSNASAYVSGRF